MARKIPQDPSPDPRERASVVRESVKELKHRVHAFDAGIRKLEEDAAGLRAKGDTKNAAALDRRAVVLRSELGKLIDEVAGVPEVADALGLVARPEADPPEIVNVVKSAEFETFDITVKEQPSLGFAPLSPEWPRTGQVIEGGEIVQVQTVGKFRIQANGVGAEPAGPVPFRVVATDTGSGEQVVLRNGKTDGNGYASVNLGNMPMDRLSEVAIVVGAGDESEAQVTAIAAEAIRTHRDLGIAHQVTIRPDILDRLREHIADAGPDKPGTIEDPDDADIRNSPESFGLNEKHVDGNCCLRPRAEFAARQYHFRQIVRLSDPDLVAGNKTFNRRDVRAPIRFGKESPGYYSPAGGNLLLGTVNMYRQGWYPVGRGLGEVLYSLALAPCEHVNLAFIDWSRRERDTRAETRVEREQLEHELSHDRSISEVVDAVLTERQSGRSSSGGGGASLDLGFFSIGGGGGSTSSSTSGRRNLQASTLQNVSDEVTQRASALRSQRSTVVTTSAQRESERIQTRTVHNHNRNHAMTVQYFQVLSHYAVKTELVEEKPVLLVPYQIDPDIFDDIPSFDKFVLAPSRPITRFLDRHSRLIRRMVSRRYRRAFESLSRLLHCRDVYDIEQPYATFSRWNIKLDRAWRPGVTLSIETKSGQSIRLTPRGGSGDKAPAEFVSDPVKSDDIDGLRISFEPAESAREVSGSGVFGFLGDAVGGAVGDVLGTAVGGILESAVKHKIEGVEVNVRTDRSRFVPEPQSFRLSAGAVNTTLSADNPSVTVALSPPTVNFEGYRGREHQDYCRLKELIAYIQSQPMRFMRAIWYYEDPDRRALRFDRFKFRGQSLLDSIVNRPVGMLGNYVAFELLEGHRLVKIEAPNFMVSSRLVSLPTRGVFAEVFLSCCNATEKRDVERFIDPDQRCDVRAPEIVGVTPGSRASRGDTTPTPFPAPIVNLQNAPGIPDPTGLAAGLGVLGTPNIFRDLSRGAELLKFVGDATREAFTSTRQHRAAMDALAGDLVKGLLTAYTGIPFTGGGSSTPSLGASASGSGGSSAGGGGSGSGASGSAPSLGPQPGSSSGSPVGFDGGNPLIAAAAGEAVRNSQPGRVFDMQQLIRGAVQRGDMPEAAGEVAMANLLGSTSGGAAVVPAAFVTPPSSGGLVEPVPRPCCVLRPTIPGIDNIVELADLTTHVYGKSAYPFTEKSGHIYTCNGGFVDLGHARDWLDYTGFLAAHAKASLSAGGAVSLRPDGSTRTVRFIAQGSVPSDELCIALGQRIAYELAVWHEIVTWFPGSGQRYSSFSPEDNFSNLLGTFMGADALRSPKPFEDAAVDAISTWLTALKARPRKDTQDAMTAVKGRWWQDTLNPLAADAVLRRHFDAMGTVKPWLVAGVAACAGETEQSLTVPDKGPAGQDLTKLYSVEFGVPTVFPAAVHGLTANGGVGPVIPGDFPALIAHIRADAKDPANFGPDADKP